MADINEEARIPVYINDEQAKSALKTLTAEAAKWKKQMFEAMAANDLTGMKQAEDQLKKVNRQMSNLKKEAFDANLVLQNLSNASRTDILKTEQAIRKQIESVKRGTQEYKQYHAQLQKVLAEKNKINAELNGQIRSQQGFFSRAADGFNKYFAVATAAVASLTGIAFGFKKASQASNDFEERVDNLSSLTGLAGDELQWLEQRAKDLSTSVLDGGVIVKQGAQEIVDAFTKTGSARPELLQNKEALSAVTEESIILANAAKTELQPAIESLTMMLNQFNAPASDSRRIINALAAGSKAGAGEIPYLTQATEKAGTVAADAGLNYETLIATIETLAPRITQAEIAGRSLKGVILDMQTGADDINPSIVGWTTALENLGKKNYSTAQLTKMFGTENITTAKILIDNVAELKRYEAAVTGTNVAIEQATINTGNNNAKLAQARNELNLVTLDLGKKLAPAMVVSTNGFTWFVKVASASLDFISKHGKALIIAGSAIAGYTIAIKSAAFFEAAYAGVKALLTGQITRATIAQTAWNIALKANPIGLIIGIIAGGIAWLISWNKETGKITEAFKKLGPVFADIKKWFTDMYNESFLVRAGFHYFFAMLSTGFTAVTVVLRSFWEQLKLGGKLLKAVLTFDLKGIKEAFADYSSNMKNVVTDSAKKVGETWATGFNSAIKGQIKPIQVPVYGPLQAKQNTEFTFSGIGDMIQSQNPYVRPGTPSPGKKSKPEKSAEEQEKENEDALKKAQEAFDKAATEEKNKLKQQLLDKKLTQEQFNMEMYSLELAHLVAMKELRARFGEETATVDAQILDKKIEGENLVNKQIEDAEKLNNQVKQDLAKEWEQQQNDVLKEMADSAAEYTKNQEEQTLAQIEIDTQKKKAAEELRDAQIKSAAEAGMAAVENAQTLEEAGKAVINSIRAQIKAYLAEFVITAALKALKNVPFPFNMIAATVAGGAATFLFNKLIPEFYAGGDTGAGGKYEPAGIVHRKEYVIPSEGTENPQLRPFIDIMEIARRNGSLARLDLRQVVQAIPSKGFSSGGFASQPSALSSSPSALGSITSSNPGLSEKTITNLTIAINQFMQYRPPVSIEEFEKKWNAYNDVKTKRNL